MVEGSMTGRGMSVAIVGAGRMGRRYIHAARELGLDIVGVCDPEASALQAAATECGLPDSRRFQDAGEMLARSRPVIVVVASPGPHHAAAVELAASAGAKFVACEKPMATSGAEARRMAEACARQSCRLGVNLSRRFSQRYRNLRQLLQAGGIGRVRYLSFAIGAGGLGCVGTHYFDLAAWLMDARPVWVAGEIDATVTPNVRGHQYIDPGGRGSVGYENGATASFELSGDVQSTGVFTIVGTHGVVEGDELTGPLWGRIDISARPEESWEEPMTRFVKPRRFPLTFDEPLDPVAWATAFLRDLLADHREPTAAAGIDAVDTVMAFHLSSRLGGARVRLPLAGTDAEFRVPIT